MRCYELERSIQLVVEAETIIKKLFNVEFFSQPLSLFSAAQTSTVSKVFKTWSFLLVILDEHFLLNYHAFCIYYPRVCSTSFTMFATSVVQMFLQKLFWRSSVSSLCLLSIKILQKQILPLQLMFTMCVCSFYLMQPECWCGCQCCSWVLRLKCASLRHFKRIQAESSLPEGLGGNWL